MSKYTFLQVLHKLISSLPHCGQSAVQSLSCVRLFVTPWTAACQASLSFTISQSLFKFMSIESVMSCNHLMFCHPLLLLPSIFPSIRVFAKLLEWPEWPSGQSIGTSTSTSVLPMNIQGGFPLGLTVLISLLPKEPSRVFSSTIVRKHQFSCAQPSWAVSISSSEHS